MGAAKTKSSKTTRQSKKQAYRRRRRSGCKIEVSWCVQSGARATMLPALVVGCLWSSPSMLWACLRLAGARPCEGCGAWQKHPRHLRSTWAPCRRSCRPWNRRWVSAVFVECKSRRSACRGDRHIFLRLGFPWAHADCMKSDWVSTRTHSKPRVLLYKLKAALGQTRKVGQQVRSQQNSTGRNTGQGALCVGREREGRSNDTLTCCFSEHEGSSILRRSCQSLPAQLGP